MISKKYKLEYVLYNTSFTYAFGKRFGYTYESQTYLRSRYYDY